VRRASTHALVVLMAVTFLAGCTVFERAYGDWWQLERGASGQAPDPMAAPEAVVQVYAARTVGWRGLFAVHTWIAVKPTGAPAYTRYEVIGWGVNQGAPSVRVNRTGPDNYWFGDRPVKLVDLRGPGVDAVIAKIDAAVAAYPYPTTYRTWPGPNSNTFTAWVARAVPELGVDLPPTAIGKDWLPNGDVVGRSPSGTGFQLSLFGVAGFIVSWEEGVEVNLFSLVFGVDVKGPALKLPLLGRVGAS